MLGHVAIGLGVLLRRLSVPSTLLVFAALALSGATSVGGDVGTWWILGLPLSVLVVARSVAVGCGALGWLVFPPEHRAVLSEIAS